MFPIPVEDILRAALIFIRVGGIIFALPVFGDEPTPVRVRILLAVAITLGISPVVPSTWMRELPQEVLTYGLYMGRELMVGLLLGFVARLFFAGIQMAAEIVGFQMGFGTASLFVADADQQMNSFTAFHRVIVMIIFLCLDLHHVFFKGMVESFNIIPAGTAAMKGSLAELLITTSSQIFYVGLQLAAPVLVALMFTMSALGLVARTVPQMNVFTMSFPISFFVGLLVYIATLPMFPGWMENNFAQSSGAFMASLRGLAP